jgi:hypothetical protein
LATPSADSTALSARRSRTLAATLAENPIAASSIAARPSASAAWRGGTDSELPSRAAVRAARSVTEAPRSTAGTSPLEVASHHSVTGSGVADRLARMACTGAWSTTSAPPPPTVGNARTAATIRTGIVTPLTDNGRILPTSELAARRNAAVAMAGTGPAGPRAVMVTCPTKPPFAVKLAASAFADGL